MAQYEDDVEQELRDEELDEEELPPEGGGFFDSLSDQFGTAPWWVASMPVRAPVRGQDFVTSKLNSQPQCMYLTFLYRY